MESKIRQEESDRRQWTLCGRREKIAEKLTTENFALDVGDTALPLLWIRREQSWKSKGMRIKKEASRQEKLMKQKVEEPKSEDRLQMHDSTETTIVRTLPCPASSAHSFIFNTLFAIRSISALVSSGPTAASTRMPRWMEETSCRSTVTDADVTRCRMAVHARGRGTVLVNLEL